MKEPRKIRNPFRGLDGYNCFGCSPDNSFGLKMTFVEEGEELISRWDPQSRFQGYLDLLHGGIQATLMDEIASWTVYVKHKVAGMTSRMNVRYYKPVSTVEGPLTLRSKIIAVRKNLVDIGVRLFDHSDVLCSEAVVTYFTYSAQKSKENLYYPDHSAFFEKDRDQAGS